MDRASSLLDAQVFEQHNGTMRWPHTQHYQFGIQACLAPNQRTIITVPLMSFSNNRGHKWTNYKEHHWYLTINLQVVAHTKSQWKDWGTTQHAIRDKKIMSLAWDTTDTTLKVTADLTKGQIIHNKNKCCCFYLKAYVSGTDLAFKLIFCTFPLTRCEYPCASSHRIHSSS